MKKLSLLLLCGTLAASTLTFNACVKKGHDEPIDNTGNDPKIPVTHTIAQVLAMPIGTAITEDVVVSGIVVMDDRSGNYYKKFVIQDETGGLEINLDQNNIYNDYPVGRKVYIKCKGLTMGTYGGMIQLGYGLDERQSIVAIPFAMADNFIVKANYPNPIKVDTFSYDELANAEANGARLNTLVAIRNTQFTNPGQPYAAPSGTTNRDLEGCGASGTGIVLRTSNYSRFQPVTTPTGSGVIVGLYTKFVSGSRSTPQLFIRDTTDVRFSGARCGSANGVTLFSEDFTGGAANAIVSLTGWSNVAEAGTMQYVYGGSNPYAKITAYQSGQSDVKSWLITPAVNLSGYSTYALSLRSTYGFPDAATLKAYVTTSYNGNPAAASWTELDAITVSGQANWAWKDINVSIPASFAGQQVYIGFKYTGSSSGATGTFEVDDIKVLGN